MGAFDASTSSPALAVPASLHASLMARLDRLGSAKGVAQIGAAIGREFSHALLKLVTGLDDSELGDALDRLIHSGLLRAGRSRPMRPISSSTHSYRTAYGTLLREPRHARHARIAEVLEGQFPRYCRKPAELLARHCAQAGLIEKAARFWGAAGRRSLARSALVEAAAQRPLPRNRWRGGPADLRVPIG